jgi:CheY-like chemotaxis protein
VKFTSKGGRIHISAKPINNNHVQVSVMDTGIGMNKDMIADLFRLDINTSRNGTEGESSSGLGLIICKDFIEKHGGVLWVESQEGKGSTFHFTLPQNAKLPETPPVQNNAPAKETDQAAKKLKILIAENDETSEMLISIAVKPFSKEVLTVRSGVDAVEACRNNPDIDLILMDIQMPWMNGYEATRLIRQFNKEVIIIAQTAYSQIDDRENAIESGCNYYISKPLNLSLLKELLQKHF